MRKPLEPHRSSRPHRRPTPWWPLAILLLGIATPLWAQELPEPGTWRTVANLNQARAGHTATLLANGSVLIAGGRDASGHALSAAEIFDPSTGQYTPISAAVPTPVWGHTATLLADGSVLIAGGRDDLGRPIASAQLFDPSSSTFTSVGFMATARGAETEKIRGLKLGADDYITKPLSFPELMARIEAALRRAATAPAEAPTPIAAKSSGLSPALTARFSTALKPQGSFERPRSSDSPSRTPSYATPSTRASARPGAPAPTAKSRKP